jgi:DNA topoisomerase-2
MAGFEWLSSREAVLLRPDAYVGAVDASTEEGLQLDEQGLAQPFAYTCSPIWLKIFDEVLVNALDSAMRDALVRRIACWFSEDGTICVENDGSGIPVELFKDTQLYIPTVIFSELHAGSNFNDDDARLTGGRNGVGASCTNVWSKFFEVDICDTRRHFQQRFRENLSVVEEAQVSESLSKRGHVRVRFQPDYERLKVDVRGEGAALRALLLWRCREAAVTVRAGVRVLFEGEELPRRGGDLLRALSHCADVVQEDCGEADGAGCALWLSPRRAGADFYGFVNCIRCDGGSLAAHVRERLHRAVSDWAQRKHGMMVRAQTVRDALAVLCAARVVNPRFTSQAKTSLATPARQLGFALEPNARLLGKLTKLGVLADIVRRESERDLASSLRKTMTPRNREVMIDKYDAALDARRQPEACTLILTEGDSAKAFVVAGLSVLGRERFGVFPLRGVPLNVTNLAVPKLLQNKEIANIFRILNVSPLSDGSGLRYGSVAICSDQDSDGAHICGLLINLFARCLPQVFAERRDFLRRIVTPLVKARHRRREETLSFFSLPDFRAWAESADLSSWTLKYYKGLGTSSSREAREVFSELEKHCIAFDADAGATDVLGKFYDERRADERKQLLTTDYDADASVDYSRARVTVSDYMLREHAHFSH